MKNYFSTNMKYIRLQKGLSQNKFSQLLNVNQTTIARWEDENRTPTIDKAIDVSIKLNIPLNNLIGKDLRLKEEGSCSMTKTQELELLNNILKEKGFLKENEVISEKEFNNLIEFAKANKKFIINS